MRKLIISFVLTLVALAVSIGPVLAGDIGPTP